MNLPLAFTPSRPCRLPDLAVTVTVTEAEAETETETEAVAEERGLTKIPNSIHSFQSKDPSS